MPNAGYLMVDGNAFYPDIYDSGWLPLNPISSLTVNTGYGFRPRYRIVGKTVYIMVDVTANKKITKWGNLFEGDYPRPDVYTKRFYTMDNISLNVTVNRNGIESQLDIESGTRIFIQDCYLID
ncbi:MULTISPECIES: hypothetical protein [unclassified Breznakia]|uniref:hypothetical protein n=1 Tax=unclassified Breznakia TaxID=2623764 RepID=UPI002473E21E|nr:MULTISPECIES: hypothetical protein [unclassified Breznakia]MDH6367564.1 hypothetical protein [Breznakia sp. PH1-1]MDH6404642.1 hypothetical protein [Breznakia sp. PF1-11]MDH6412394.1 hypothetical protein [Breznakia sp. PFB1-11]MDH6414732.1 hypothetical protein [Breznakia sp. PFB1-14]MDH6417023.1 hypothetical protein [Breznakia sp. PFB1-4]